MRNIKKAVKNYMTKLEIIKNKNISIIVNNNMRVRLDLVEKPKILSIEGDLASIELNQDLYDHLNKKVNQEVIIS